MTPKRETAKSDLTLVVDPGTIEQFEDTAPDAQTLERQIFQANETLALFIRRRAIQRTDDMHAREADSTLAFEVAALVSRQIAIDGLNRLYEISNDTKLPPAA
jgi:hypothetical protein